MCKPKVVKKLAFYIGDKRVTDYIYDDGKTYADVTIMRCKETIDVFDNNTGEMRTSLQNVLNFDVQEDCIITFDGQAYSAYTYSGVNVLAPIYAAIYKNGDYFVFKTKSGKVGVYKWENDFLNLVIPSNEFIGAQLHLAGINVVKEVNGKMLRGFYSYDGKEIIPPIYKEINFNLNNIHVITPELYYGIFNYEGEQIIPPEYNFIKPYKDCYVVGIFDSKEYKYGLYTKEGKQILKARYDHYEIDSPLVYFTKNFKMCAYRLNDGKRILPLKYESIHKYYGVIFGTENYREYFIYSAKTGEKMLDESFDGVFKAMPYVLVLRKKHKKFYYLISYNKLLDVHDYTVKYNEEDKKIYVRKLSRDKKGKIFFKTHWIPYMDS